ncbi:hypothetical protein ACTXT7_016035 [Hymenolepis weldensis]
MGIHIACGKKRPKKKGFSYFLCCGCGTEDDSEIFKRNSAAKPGRRNLPSSVTESNSTIIVTLGGTSYTTLNKVHRVNTTSQNSTEQTPIGGGVANPEILPSYDIHHKHNRKEAEVGRTV